MTAVLGVSALYHDAAAALVVDGQVIAAVQEERLSRIKNDASIPTRAISACLRIAGLRAADLDGAVFYENPYAKLERVMVGLLRSFPRSYGVFPQAMGAQIGSKVWVLDSIAEAAGIAREKVSHVSHHESHAASAFFASPYERAAVLTADGVGEEETTTLWLGEGKTLRQLGSLTFPHSLGLLYAALTAWLGFAVNEGESKVMGLAAYGEPHFRKQFDELLQIRADGSFTLGRKYFALLEDTEVGFSFALEKLLGPRRSQRQSWDLTTAADQRYANVAATLQAVTEDALLALAREARRRTDADALCLAGGVALNCVANARLAREAGFARVFVQPAAGDAGGALGAAMLGALARGAPRTAPMRSSALGGDVEVARFAEVAAALGVETLCVADPARAAAERIAKGQVVAWCEGRAEWGPRALGQRSLLARPDDVALRERLNRLVKRREPFRPFAPSVLASRTAALFGLGADDMTPFMTTVRSVRPDARATLAGVTHVDGTARVQTVADGSGAYAALLAAVGEATGEPVVLDTSLNGAGEPIVDGPEDALAFLLAHPIDALIYGDLVCERP